MLLQRFRKQLKLDKKSTFLDIGQFQAQKIFKKSNWAKDTIVISLKEELKGSNTDRLSKLP